MNLSFDGKGINGPDEFRTRIATFTSDEAAKVYGPMFAAVGDLVVALRECITDDGAACMNTGQKTRRLQAINKIALEAIGKVIGQ
jgi:hypothetical protein